MDTHNWDLGSSSPVLVPDLTGPNPHIMVGGGKGQSVYVMNRDNMGHFNPNGNQDLTLTYKYQCTSANQTTINGVAGYCLSGNGNYAQTNNTFGITPNQFGRRVLEISLKYKF